MCGFTRMCVCVSVCACVRVSEHTCKKHREELYIQYMCLWEYGCVCVCDVCVVFVLTACGCGVLTSVCVCVRASVCVMCDISELLVWFVIFVNCLCMW